MEAQIASTRSAAVLAVQPPAAAHTVCDALLDGLYALGVRQAFGIVGGAIAPLADALAHGPLQAICCRHEGGAGFAAVEAHFASNRPTVVFVTTGPGVTNAITGLTAARAEGAKVLLISGATNAAQRGRGACQETSVESMPSGIVTDGVLFHFAMTLEHPAQLEVALQRIAAGFAQPQGFVAHLALPLVTQSAALPRSTVHVPEHLDVGCHPAALADVTERLRRPTVIWAGFGARHASQSLVALAERTGSPVMCTPRAKGVFPESHPLYLGLTGLGGHGSVDAYFAQKRPANVLVLGTRLGEPSCYWNPAFLPSDALIHVDVDPCVAGAAYPQANTLFVHSEVGAFLRGVLDALSSGPLPLREVKGPGAPLAFDPQPGLVRPQMVFAAVQERIVEKTSALVMTESGNSFAWGNQLLRVERPGRYRVSVGFGSMGHAATGVVGAALARDGKAVAVVGDGSMLMATEISTAVHYRARAVWIVLNDACYGMVEKGMRALGFTPLDTSLPLTDFAMVARGLGADGVCVEAEEQLPAAIDSAMAAPGPFVIDVLIDPWQTAPWMRRIQNLIAQGAEGSAK